VNDKIGVFICDCGDQIAGILDIEALIESAEKLPDVIYAGHAPYWCSADGRERLEATVRSEGLERVVVAGCSPRTHLRLFQETVAQAGLNPNLLGLVNIREGCAWPHRAELEAATTRARDQIEMEVVRLAALDQFPSTAVEITPTALVIGGGVAGMTVALELADAGIPVTLVERKVTLGGRAIADNSELEADLAVAVQAHPHVSLQLNGQIAGVTGSVGAYQVTITPPKEGERHGPFGAIIVATGIPDEETKELAKLLRLRQDADGFLPEWRVRLRPGHYLGRGIYVCGSVHYPCDVAEAQFQAYSTASRALRHLRQGSVTARGPVAQVHPEKCNGCSDCFQVCPFAAVTMVERSDGLGRSNFYAPDRPTTGPATAHRPAASVNLTPPGLHQQPAPTEGQGPVTIRSAEGSYPELVEGLSLAVIDPLLCTGCGNCVSVCPVGAVTVAGWTEVQLETQMRVALSREGRNNRPRVLVFACEWSGLAAAELAGARQLSYPANVRLIRLGCSGRLQPGLILKAFELGAAGVLVLGCASKFCHYERGSERVMAAYAQVEALAGLLGLPPTRLQLAWTPPDSGLAFAELVTEFVKGVEESIEAVV